MQNDSTPRGGASIAAASAPNPLRRRLLMASALGAGTALVGCGGGSGDTPPPPPPTFDATLVYGVVSGGIQSLYLYRPGAAPQALAPQLAGGVDTFELTPDRRAVVCLARESAGQPTFVYSVDLTAPFAFRRLNPLPLNGPGSVRVFRISPDSARVAFTGDLNTLNVVEVYVAPIGGGTYLRVNGSVGSPPSVELDLPFPQAWSPDGRYLLQGVRDLASGRRIGLNVYERNAGDNSTRITPPLTINNAAIGEARWLPDSSGVVFVALLRSSIVQEPVLVRLAQPRVPLYLIDAAVGATAATNITFSPDARTVYYLGGFDVITRSDLYAVPLTATAGRAGREVLIGGPRSAGTNGVSRYALSPDGTRIAYVSDEQGNRQLFETGASAVAGAPVTVLNGPLAAGASVSTFAYSPDGTAVIYRAGIDQRGGAGDPMHDLYIVQRATPARPQRINGAAVNNGSAEDMVAITTPRGAAAVYAGDLITNNVREVFYTFLNDLGKSTRLNAPLAAGSSVGGWQTR